MFKVDQSTEFKQHKVRRLAEEHDLTVAELLELKGGDSVVPGICMNRGCDFIMEYEPDQREGWCDDCDTPTVTSLLVLLEVI